MKTEFVYLISYHLFVNLYRTSVSRLFHKCSTLKNNITLTLCIWFILFLGVNISGYLLYHLAFMVLHRPAALLQGVNTWHT